MMLSNVTRYPNSGFTLIELSVILVTIGLVMGGIVTGLHLIDTSSQQAQITQINKYTAAVNLFETKYNGYLPGDLPDPYATQYGFQSRGSYTGEGDGDGELQGNCHNTSGDNNHFNTGCGELAVFWQDLSTAGLIDTQVGTGTCLPNTTGGVGNGCNIDLKHTPGVKDWLPTAKLGNGNFVYMWSANKINYFAVSSVTSIGNSIQGGNNPGITVQQAYNIDNKIDDGLPQSGDVTACYVNYNIKNFAAIYAAGNSNLGANNGQYNTGAGDVWCTPTTAAVFPANTDCFGNNNFPGTMQYSVSANGNAQNCALSFKLQ